MIQKLRTLGVFHSHTDEGEEETRAFPALRLLTAQLLLTTGIESARDALRAPEPKVAESPGYDRNAWQTQREPRRAVSYTARWSPLLLGSAAAVAQVVHAVRPSPATRAATRVLNAGVIGVGVAGLLQNRSPAPLAMEAAGVMGLLLDRQERLTQQERERLQRRADLVERLVPRRRPKLDRVVVHV
jgi:hypothetical protein